MKKFITTLVLLGIVSMGFSQKLNMEKFKGMKPRSIGPASMSGRITAIDAVISNPDIIYAGAASGGVWKSTSGGASWTPLFDKESTLSVGAIAIQQDNPSVVWVGTGEGNPRNSLNGGDGIYKSLDGGVTWKKMGLEKTRHIHRIIIDPKSTNTVYVGSIGSPWGDHPERGVYKTTDGGVTWSQILSVDSRTGLGELVMDPANPNKLIANMWEHRRQPWTFKSGGPGSGLHITYDGGKTWKKITSKNGLPEGELGRMGLAIARSKPEVVYALVEAKKNALYRSEDGGEKWTMINDKSEIGDRPFYYFEIYVDPKNENRVYTIYSGVNISEDGGKSFSRTQSGIHPDHHAWWINPENPNLIIEGNDGGVNISRDRAQTWAFAENIPVGQFYHINVDMDQPYNVYGGLQDNGSWAGPAYVWRSGGIRNSYWQELFFGDGFDVVSDPDNSRYGYAMSQGGNLGRYDLATGQTSFIRPTHPDANFTLRYNWNAAIAQDPFNNNTIYYCSQLVHKSTNKGTTWEIISPDLTTNNPDKQKQFESGGLTMDATGAENHCTILTVAPSPVKEGVIWVGTDDGNVQLTQDGGKSWANVSAGIAGMPKNAWVAQIQPSRKNAGEAFVVVNNYRQFDYKPYLFRTRDFGKTWESLVSSAQVGESNYTLAVAQDPEEPKLLFLGAENGLFVSIDEGRNWTKWTNDFPAGVPVMDLVIHPREHDLVIGTFGRAIWVLDDIRPLRELAKSGESAMAGVVKVFPAPDAFLASVQQPSGPRFEADAIFNGQNRPLGARITYAMNKPEEKKEEKVTAKPDTKSGKKTAEAPAAKPESKGDKGAVKYDSVKLEIVNGKGEVINTIRQKAPEDNGMQRMTWNLTEKSERQPSREKPREGQGGGGGFGGFGGTQVLPGTYKLRLSYGGQKDSTMVSVKADPRSDAPVSILEERFAMTKGLQKLTKVTSLATERLRESKEVVEDFEKRIKDSKRKDLKEASDKTKAMKDTINLVFDYILGKEDKRQGIVRSPDPSRYSYVQTAQQYVGRSRNLVSETDHRVMKHAEDKIAEIVSRVNAFYETAWPAYKAAMEKVELSPFKAYEPLKQN
ncbi:MAG: hypothetical protein SH819_01340 [Cytophagales bacterium]|nr:hypothetical protein [Cytophagales bacterium]